MHPSITSQLARDRHQERIAEAAREQFARGHSQTQAARPVRVAHWTRWLQEVPRPWQGGAGIHQLFRRANPRTTADTTIG